MCEASSIFMKKGILVALTFLTLACAPVYVLNGRNIPLFDQAGEFQGQILYETSGLDAQGALAMTDHIALMANYSGNKLKDKSTTHTDCHRHAYDDGVLVHNRNVKTFCFEVFTGYGQGIASATGTYNIFPTNNQIVTCALTSVVFNGFSYLRKISSALPYPTYFNG